MDQDPAISRERKNPGAAEENRVESISRYSVYHRSSWPAFVGLVAQVFVEPGLGDVEVNAPDRGGSGLDDGAREIF